MAPPLFAIALNGVTYQIDSRKFRAQSQDALRAGAVTSTQPSDSLFNPEGAWSRYRYSWHHGMGQTMDDMRDDADLFRFYDSHLIDPWTENQATLPHLYVLRKSGGTVSCQLLAAGSYLYVGDGTSLHRTADGVTYETILTTSATIRSLATDGYTLYVATDSAVVRVENGAAVENAWSTPISAATKVAFAAGHLLIGQANALKEVATAGTTTTIKTHFQANFRWTTMFAVGSRIYVGGYAETQSELYSLTVSDAGALVVSGEATTLPSGELLYSALSHAGVVVFCTSKGARLATVGGDGTLTYGPLILATNAVSAVADGRFVWVTGSYTYLGVAYTGTVRLALDTFTETLRPAFAWDTVTTTAYAPTSVARFRGQTFIGLDQNGVFGESATAYVTLGDLISGRNYFGTVEPKYLTDLAVNFGSLLTGEAVTVTVTDSSGASVSKTESTVGATSINLTRTTTTALPLNPSTWAKVTVRLTAGPTSAPLLYQWRLRAFPVAPAVSQWILPIQLVRRFSVGAGAGQSVSQDVHAQFDAIVALFESKAPVSYQMGLTSETVRVDAYDFEPSEWSDRGDWLEGVMTVRLVSVS